LNAAFGRRFYFGFRFGAEVGRLFSRRLAWNDPPMPPGLPLSTLLSFALVAFTIEFDNEAEHRQAHRTSDYGGKASDPWLLSLAMFLNCLQFVPAQGITKRELEQQARTQPNWNGMCRWGYITFEPNPDDPRPRPPKSAWIVRATVPGRRVREMMRDLLPEIEERWRDRFGEASIASLRRALIAMLRTVPGGLPDCMPILHYGLVCEAPNPKQRGETPLESEIANLALPVLLARVLLTFALDFEKESPVSLAICANVLRVLEPEGTMLRRIPALGGISKEAVAMAVEFLKKRGFVEVVSPQAGRSLIVRMTSSGREIQSQYSQQLRFLEERWKRKLGRDGSFGLRSALEPMVGDGTRSGSLLYKGLEPYPEGWRAKERASDTLPHFPMVLHRGGFPDGS
jgi:DNA-binding MarR family transcriptional regulator